MCLQVKGALFGAKADFDNAFKLNNYTVCASYKFSDLTVASFVENGNKVRGEVVQAVNPDLTAGVRLGWTQKGDAPSLEIAGKYKFDADTTVKAKLDNKLALGLAYNQQIKAGITLNISAAVRCCFLFLCSLLSCNIFCIPSQYRSMLAT